MKFSTIATLLAASSAALAFPFEKRDLLGLSSECGKAIKEQFGSCLTTEKITFDNLDSICNNYKSENCQKVFKNGVGKIDACSKEVNTIIDALEKVIALNVSNVIDLKCAKDENGNTCPIANYVIQNGDVPSDPNDDKWKQAVDETCKSKSCSDAFINYSDASNNNPVNQPVVSGILNDVGVGAPTVNTEVVKNTADTIKANQGGDAGSSGSGSSGSDSGSTGADTTGATGTTGDAATGTTGATGANGTTGTTGAAGANGNTTNGANNGNSTTTGNNGQGNATTSGASSFAVKGSLAMAVVYALSTLLL